jgi:aminoglycoside phosphotransferase (APT) family kinase protein
VTSSGAGAARGVTAPGLSSDALALWLTGALDLSADTPLEIEVIAGGKSNLTYLVRAGDRELVLRRPPLGGRLPSAHSMRREHTVLRALGASDVPVPAVVAWCDDEEPLGVPFYVMEHVPGRVFRSPEDAGALAADEARALAVELVRTLATLHACDPAQLGLAGFGRPDGFMERQVWRWQDQLERSRPRPLSELDELGRRLAVSVPTTSRPAIVHGDYRIDNVIVDAADSGRIAAVLEWEMSTIGDPLADLGMLLLYWGQPGEAHASAVHAITALPGFPDRDEVVATYAAASSADLGDLSFYVAFAHFKLAVIVEGILARHLAGETVGDGFELIGEIAPVLAAHGLEQVRA